MSTMLGPVVYGGIHLGVILMILSGIFYFICALIVWKSYRQEKNELLGALLAFLVYQAIGMFFMGVELQTMNMLYSNIAAFAIFIGSAYMLKFPISSLPEKTRKATFLLVLIAIIGLFAWYMMTEARQMELMTFVLWYDLVVNGIVVGGSIILYGLRSFGATKVKAIGGGTGVVSCCVASNAAMIGGALLTGSFFQFLAPLLILGTLSYKRNEQQS